MQERLGKLIVNNKTLKEKMNESHKRLSREMLNYVRSSLYLNKLADDYDKTLHDVDYLKRRLCDDDILIANLLIKNCVDLDELTQICDELDKNDYVCPYGGR